MNWITTVATNLEGHWEQIGATIISAYSFVVAHGGLRSMWGKFMGPSAAEPTPQPAITTTIPQQTSQTAKP